MLFDLGPSIMAAELAAKSIYHRVLGITTEFAAWRHDNPAISHLMDEATDLAAATLTAHGVPVVAIEAMGAILPKMISATLNGMAAADATVQSGAIQAPTPAPAPVPLPTAIPVLVAPPLAPVATDAERQALVDAAMQQPVPPPAADGAVS